MTRFRDLFGQRFPVIGVIHLPPLPGYPDSPGIEAALQSALDDLSVLAKGGVDGVLVENEYDRPHRVLAGPETVSAMTRITRAIVEESRGVAVGCEILLNDPRASLAVAHSCGARFIRTDYFVDRMMRPGFGEFRIDPEGLMSYRSAIGAGDVLVLADIQVKYATMIEPRSISESARLACLRRADAVVVTGTATGNAPAAGVLREAREGVRSAGVDVPVLIGSGMTSENAAALLAECDGAIVGTALMRDRNVDAQLLEALMTRVAELRSE